MGNNQAKKKGAIASIFAAAWRFLDVRPGETAASVQQALFSMSARVRQAPDEATLSAIEAEIDSLLGTRLARIAGDEDHAGEAAMLISAAGRLDSLIHHRRAMLAVTTVADPQVGLADIFDGDRGRPEALTAPPKEADKAKDAAPQM